MYCGEASTIDNPIMSWSVWQAYAAIKDSLARLSEYFSGIIGEIGSFELSEIRLCFSAISTVLSFNPGCVDLKFS
jgi:hypothetical protein